LRLHYKLGDLSQRNTRLGCYADVLYDSLERAYISCKIYWSWCI